MKHAISMRVRSSVGVYARVIFHCVAYERQANRRRFGVERPKPLQRRHLPSAFEDRMLANLIERAEHRRDIGLPCRVYRGVKTYCPRHRLSRLARNPKRPVIADITGPNWRGPILSTPYVRNAARAIEYMQKTAVERAAGLTPGFLTDHIRI